MRSFSAALATGLAMTALILPAAPVDAQFKGAATTLTIQNGSGWQNTTGNAGQFSEEVQAPSGKVLVGIAGWESSDVPCRTQLIFGGPVGMNETEVRDHCGGGSGGVGGSLSVRFSRTPTVTRAIRQVRLCVRPNNGRMKGIRVRGAPIGASGVGTDNGLFEEDRRPRCGNNWSSGISACPAGEVVTKIRLESNGMGGGRRGVVGMNVFCSRARAST